jgi:hypothetical protein
MLSDRVVDDRNVFVRWVKEGRKYGLGCVLVTQQPSSISSQIISQGDNFFVLHLLNDDDLQTLKRHNAYFSDDILGFIRGEPIPGNCYFWSAPSQPFVLPARVQNFESICQRRTGLTTNAKEAKPDMKQIQPLIAKAVREALVSSTRVWIFRVSKLFEKEQEGLVAFSKDYLQEEVAEQVIKHSAFAELDNGDWMRTNLAKEIETVLDRHKVRSGYAVLAGVVRPVWVLAESDVKLKNGKPMRSQTVEVLDRI